MSSTPTFLPFVHEKLSHVLSFLYAASFEAENFHVFVKLYLCSTCLSVYKKCYAQWPVNVMREEKGIDTVIEFDLKHFLLCADKFSALYVTKFFEILHVLQLNFLILFLTGKSEKFSNLFLSSMLSLELSFECKHQPFIDIHLPFELTIILLYQFQIQLNQFL